MSNRLSTPHKYGWLFRVGCLVVTLAALPAQSGLSCPPIDTESLKEIQRKVQSVARERTGVVVAVTDGIGFGSGVVVSEDGLVLTAGHVLLTGGSTLKVIFPDGREVPAKAMGRNLNHDAGMIKLTEPGPWQHAELGSLASLKQGDWCVCLGHSGGYELGRRPPVRAGRIIKFESDQVVTDCALIGGDSGGPLFDLEGRVIGIHSSIGSSVAENRHVSIEIFHQYWQRLVAGEQWGQLPELADKQQQESRASLGVRVDRTDERARIKLVHKGRAAEQAGLQADDIVLRFNRINVNDSAHLIDLVGTCSPGDSVTLIVSRGGNELTIEVTLGDSR